MLMWRQIQGKFVRRKSRLNVVRKMIELGISVEGKHQLKIGKLSISDSALAEAAEVDRRVVRNTVKQIMDDKDLQVIFMNVTPIGTSLVKIADKIGYKVLVVYADPLKPGVISGISSILSSYDVIIRQALADDPDFTPEAKLTLVVEGRIPSEAIEKIQSMELVESITLK